MCGFFYLSQSKLMGVSFFLEKYQKPLAEAQDKSKGDIES